MAETSSEKEVAVETWSCPLQPGTPPSGELTAEAIAATKTTRTDPGLFEGPAWIGDALYYSDFTFGTGFPSRVQVLKSDGTVTTAIADSGSNGLAVDGEGFLFAATHDRKAISRFNPSTGEREMIVNGYDGQPFNSPNDLTLSRDGILYFTDPDYQRSAAPGGQQKTRVYQFDGEKVTVIDDTLVNPNGVSLSPDQTTLYVAGGQVVRAYPIEKGVMGAGVDLIEVETPDGMAVDCAGNLYVTEHSLQHIRVITPSGEEIARIKVDANITNAAFGGSERKTLYITGAGTLWSLELDIAGLPY
ncbi:SMP-30/gluconolactonase/LRE family protein [Pseudomaricurvus hydrocarbonicus]